MFSSLFQKNNNATSPAPADDTVVVADASPAPAASANVKRMVVYAGLGVAVILTVYFVASYYRNKESGDDIFAEDVIFDDTILEKDGEASASSEVAEESFDITENSRTVNMSNLPRESDLELLASDDLIEAKKNAEEFRSVITESSLDRLRRLVGTREFRHSYVNNLLRYYKSHGRMIIELEENLKKEERISSAHVGIDKIIDSNSNTESLREIKSYYANMLRTRKPVFDLQAVVRELDDLSGRQDVKDFIARKIIAFGTNFMTFTSTFQHALLLAPPGYGKTHIAKLMSRIFSLAGIVRDDRLLITTKKSLVSAYVNHTATLTRNCLLRSVGGLLVIDEAYSLAQSSEFGQRDHGQEAIAEIVNFIDKYRGLNMIFAAGYKYEMERDFLGSNPGLERRFPSRIVLEPFTPRELAHICIRKIDESHGFASFTPEQTRDACALIYSMINAKCVAAFGSSTAYRNQAGDMDNLSAIILSNLTIHNAGTSDPAWYRAAIIMSFQ